MSHEGTPGAHQRNRFMTSADQSSAPGEQRRGRRRRHTSDVSSRPFRSVLAGQAHAGHTGQHQSSGGIHADNAAAMLAVQARLATGLAGAHPNDALSSGNTNDSQLSDASSSIQSPYSEQQIYGYAITHDICVSHASTGSCGLGDNCRFSHPPELKGLLTEPTLTPEEKQLKLVSYVEANAPPVKEAARPNIFSRAEHDPTAELSPHAESEPGVPSVPRGASPPSAPRGGRNDASSEGMPSEYAFSIKYDICVRFISTGSCTLGPEKCNFKHPKVLEGLLVEGRFTAEERGSRMAQFKASAPPPPDSPTAAGNDSGAESAQPVSTESTRRDSHTSTPNSPFAQRRHTGSLSDVNVTQSPQSPGRNSTSGFGPQSSFGSSSVNLVGPLVVTDEVFPNSDWSHAFPAVRDLCVRHIATGNCMLGQTCQFEHPVILQGLCKAKAKAGEICYDFLLSNQCRGRFCKRTHCRLPSFLLTRKPPTGVCFPFWYGQSRSGQTCGLPHCPYEHIMEEHAVRQTLDTNDRKASIIFRDTCRRFMYAFEQASRGEPIHPCPVPAATLSGPGPFLVQDLQNQLAICCQHIFSLLMDSFSVARLGASSSSGHSRSGSGQLDLSTSSAPGTSAPTGTPISATASPGNNGAPGALQREESILRDRGPVSLRFARRLDSFLWDWNELVFIHPPNPDKLLAALQTSISDAETVIAAFDAIDPNGAAGVEALANQLAAMQTAAAAVAAKNRLASSGSSDTGAGAAIPAPSPSAGHPPTAPMSAPGALMQGGGKGHRHKAHSTTGVLPPAMTAASPGGASNNPATTTAGFPFTQPPTPSSQQGTPTQQQMYMASLVNQHHLQQQQLQAQQRLLQQQQQQLQQLSGGRHPTIGNLPASLPAPGLPASWGTPPSSGVGNAGMNANRTPGTPGQSRDIAGSLHSDLPLGDQAGSFPHHFGFPLHNQHTATVGNDDQSSIDASSHHVGSAPMHSHLGNTNSYSPSAGHTPSATVAIPRPRDIPHARHQSGSVGGMDTPLHSTPAEESSFSLFSSFAFSPPTRSDLMFPPVDDPVLSGERGADDA